HFRSVAASQGLDERLVRFRGPVANSVALGELRSAHVGLVPHWKDDSWDTTVPNKLFDYMAAGLAVVTSDAAPAARIVRATECGVVFRSRDPGDLAFAIRTLKDSAVRLRAAERGRAAIRSTYHWEQDVQRLFGLLGNVVS